MKRILLSLIIVLLFSSCSTMLLDSTHVVNVQSNLRNAKVKVKDSIYQLPANIEVKRSNEDLHLTLISNTNEIPFKAKHRLTGTFKYANILGIYTEYFAPAFYLIDLTNNKRFHYGKSLWLNNAVKDSSVTVLDKNDKRYRYVDSLSYYKHYIYKKGDFRINASLSPLNIFKLRPGNHITAYGANFAGFSVGAEYFHKKDQFINATYTKIIGNNPTDLIIGIYTWFLTGVYQEINSDYFRITNNHIIDRFSLGYGLSYGNTHLSRTNIYDSTDSINKRYDVFGLSFPAYYQAGRNIHLGLIYNPSFFRANQSNQWEYEHLISFDLAWKMKL